jgi:predicted DNA-binding WGR domain protein
MATVSHFTNTTPGHSKFWSVWVQDDKLITQYGKIGTQGAQSVKPFASAAAAENAKIKLINEKVAKGYIGKPLATVPKTPGAASPQKVVGAKVKPAASAPLVSPTPTIASQNDAMYQSASSPLAMDAWKKTGEQKGHNAGGTYVDESGQSWYCKFPAGGEKVARNELLATRLYALAGVSTASMRLVSQGGKIGVASKIVTGATTDKAALLKGKADGLLSGFAVDAWLANWDTVGSNPAAGKGFDNIMFKPDGSAVRIDAGGALLYGGAGGSKQTFGDKVIELKTMLDPHKNPNTAAVFGKMSPGDIAASVAKVAAIPDAAILDFCQKFGPGSEAERQLLAARLIARKADMLAQYPQAAKKPSVKVEKPKPDPAKLKVDAAQLPPLHDFMNWSGPGKPISDKPYVQENIKDETALQHCALQGNLIALKNYQFAQVDKLTGLPTGVMQPIEQHPSNHVKAYHSDLVAALTAIAYPPERPRHLIPKLVDGIVDLSKTFPSKGRGATVENIAANERLAFWMLLGAVANVDDFRPPQTPLISSKAKQAAHAAYAKLGASSLAKRFINRVQSSGSYNDYFRDGKIKDSQGTDLIAMNQAIHAYATEQPAGTTIHKWINMSDAQVKALVATPEGTVFENAGSMCCSTSPTGTSGFGPHRMVIRYAPGAKGVDSFGSGAFGSEAEITTLPGARYMILSSKMVHCPVKGKQRLELEVLMLPPDPTYLASLNN